MATQSVQTFGRKKTAVAVVHCKAGKGIIKFNGAPIELIQPETLRIKAMEPVLLLGKQRFANLDLRIRVKGGGHVSQMYAVRQAIAKAIVAYYQKYVDEQSKKELKDALLTYDRTLLVADPRRMEPKKFGGRGARARFQKSYR
ncbi:uncharacterized protein MICPUCDRAFT_62402 [Micromonas pusilla CCMP1545]|uniref:Small ribosomal subunit protein uS9c n=2 Tax=Micromonas pusilla TaxID=38833 RepID=C1MM77_MICPC|nr:uncharacterized protein MICPUCDRAFT_62402 [Micromonas pusilla CCMP1545]EEH58531.1 predicted protein [Micromonas pusilla CCMP1545]|mmetsp:Transcript_42739/g.102234  ORF Transcript_42739/g.102234 Transcript_42739/m.102234 type:complete len:143 (+) Transcript_42739:57-485(+)|eukprot:XP_003056886.1 predicted protein [Micromonas pusilla CCMP1545]